MHRTRFTRSAILAATLAGVIALPLSSSAQSSSRDIQAKAPADNTQAARQAIIGGRARNVILLLGDGMGDSEITIARNYQVGADGRLAMDSLPLTGEYTTYAVQKDDPTLPDYVTDSAASGTGWATGNKTYNGAISVKPNEKPVPTILELAKAAGYRTGDITTAELTDATPAVLASHVVDRGCQGPAEHGRAARRTPIENGGAGSIAEQMVDTTPDILMGGGGGRFDQTVHRRPVRRADRPPAGPGEGLQRRRHRSRLDAANAKKPLLGLFAPVNMDLEWTGPSPDTHRHGASTTCRPQRGPPVDRAAPGGDDKQDPAPARPADAKQAARASSSRWRAPRSTSRTMQPTRVGRSVRPSTSTSHRRWPRLRADHPDTLVVVTADHGHTSQIVEARHAPRPGVTATLDHARRRAHDRLLRDRRRSRHPSSTPAPRSGSPRRAPRRRTCSGVTNQTDLFSTFEAALGLT